MKKSLYILILLFTATANQTVSAWPFGKSEPIVDTVEQHIKDVAIQHIPALKGVNLVPAAIAVGALFSFAHAGGNDWRTWSRNWYKLHTLGLLSSGAFAWHTKSWPVLLSYLAGAAAVTVFRLGHGLCQQAVEYVHGCFSVQAAPNAREAAPQAPHVNVNIQQ